MVGRAHPMGQKDVCRHFPDIVLRNVNFVNRNRSRPSMGIDGQSQVENFEPMVSAWLIG
jgi:hypothetical protein